MGSNVIHDYVAGALGGSAGLVVGHPFDTTKVQLQTCTGSSNPYSSTSAAFKSINQEGWVRGFFRGLAAPLISYGVVNSVFFGVYGNTLKAISGGQEKPSHLLTCVAGCAGGAAQLIPACPADVVKVVLQSQIPKHNDKKRAEHVVQHRGRYFKGPMECVKHIYEERGLRRGLYKGLSVMAMRDLPASTSYFLIFEVTNEYMLERRWTDSAGVFSNLMAGGLAGVLSWWLIVPVDVIKNQVQADYRGEKFKNAWHCAKLTYQKGGIPIFFTGALVISLRAFPVNAVTFLVYKKSLELLDYIKRSPITE